MVSKRPLFFTYCFTGVSTSQLEIQTSYWHPPSKWGDTLLVGGSNQIGLTSFPQISGIFSNLKKHTIQLPCDFEDCGVPNSSRILVRKYIIPGSKLLPHHRVDRPPGELLDLKKFPPDLKIHGLNPQGISPWTPPRTWDVPATYTTPLK